MAIKYVVAGLFGCGAAVLAWQYTHQPGPVFQTEPVERGDMQSTVVSTGTCSALVTVLVGTQVSGIVKKLYADFNTGVHKGQLLAEIDPEPFVAKLTQAKAALESARAAVDAAKAGAEKARADIESAKQQEESQKHLADVAASAEGFAKLQADRAAELARAAVGTVSDQIAAQSNFDVSVDTQATAEALKEQADVAVKAGEEAYQSAQTQVTNADAQVRQAQGVVEQAQLDLDHTKIVSPTDGVVLSRDVDVGQTVAASFSAPTLFEIAQDLTQMQVDANVDESEISKVKVGEEATFTVDALPGVTFHAAVGQVRENPINVQNVITFDVVLRLDNPGMRLFPGMTANIHLMTAQRNGVLKIPSAALRFVPFGVKPTPKVQTVYVLDAVGKPARRTVDTGITDGRFMELTSGEVHEGDKVIISEVRRPK